MRQPPVDAARPVRSPSRWRLFRRVYCFVGAVAMAAAGALLSVAVPAGWPALLAWALYGGVLAGLLLLAFGLSRATSMGRVDDLRVRVEQAIANRTHPDMQVTGWSAFDALGEAIQRFALQQQARIDEVWREREHYRALAEDAVGIEAFFSLRGRMVWVNPAIERITGYSVEECMASRDLIGLWVYPKDQAMIRDLAQRGLHGETREDHELRLVHRDGTLTWYACRWHARRDENGHILGVRFSAQNIQRRKDAEFKLLETVAALRRAQALKEHYLNRSNEERMRLAALLDIVQLGILFVDRDRRVVYVNQPALDIWKLGDREGIVGVRDEVLIDRTLGLRLEDDNYREHIEAVVATRSRSEPYDVELADGRIIREISAVVPAPEGDRMIGRVWIYEDVTEELRSAKRLTDLAERDPLTGLYNRRRFMEELDRQMADAARRGEQLGLLCFDLDGFKAINDSYGHQAGDEVLMGLASAVSAVVRRNEMFFRLGGDEFALLVSNTEEERLVQLARRVLTRVAELEFHFEDKSAQVTVSVGVALAPQHARGRQALVAAADRAMYVAKQAGKNRWQVAGEEQGDLLGNDWGLET